MPSFHKINIFRVFSPLSNTPVGPVCGHRLRVRARPTFPTTARMSTRPLSQAGEGQTSQARPCWQTRAREGVRLFFFLFLSSYHNCPSRLQLGPSRLARAGPCHPSPPASTITHSGGQKKAMERFKKKTRNGSRSWEKKQKQPLQMLLMQQFHLKATQKRVFLFGNNSGRASEATVQLLQSRCCFFPSANQRNTYTSPLRPRAGCGSSLLNGTSQSRFVLPTYSGDERCLRRGDGPVGGFIARSSGPEGERK